MQIVSSGDNLHENVKACFLRKIEKNISLSSAELAQNGVMVKVSKS